MTESQILNRRKAEILDQQTLLLQKASESHVQLTQTEESRFQNWTRELDVINAKLGVHNPVPSFSSNGPTKFYAMGGYQTSTPLDRTKEQVSDFWASLKSPASFQSYLIRNSALGEGGSPASDGSALVPVATDPSIPNLAMVEA